MVKKILLSVLPLLFVVLPSSRAQVVQAVSVAGRYGTNISETISDVKAGDAIFAYVAGGTYPTSYSISDNVNTYTTAIPFYESTSYPGVYSQAWVATGVAGGSYTVTVTFNGGAGGPFLTLLEMSGLAPSAVDRSANNSGVSAISVGPVTTTASSEIVLGCGYSINGPVSLTPGTGYVIPANGSISANVQAAGCEFITLSSAGSYSATMTQSTGNAWSMGMSTLKTVASGSVSGPASGSGSALSSGVASSSGSALSSGAASSSGSASSSSSASSAGTASSSGSACFSALCSAAHRITLAWYPVSGATGYNIYRLGFLIGSTTTTTYVDTAVQAGQTYSYTVASLNNGGESSQQSVTMFQIPSP